MMCASRGYCHAVAYEDDQIDYCAGGRLLTRGALKLPLPPSSVLNELGPESPWRLQA